MAKPGDVTDEGIALARIRLSSAAPVLPVILAALCWSTAGLFITFLVRGRQIAPLSLAFWRMLITCLCLLAFMALTNRRLLRVRARDIAWLAGMGVLAVGTFQVLWISAVVLNGPSIASVIQCNAPIIVTLIARIIWREPLTWRKWAAIGMASLGTVLIAAPARAGAVHITAIGFLAAIGAALTYAGITLFTKKLASRYASWTILAYAFGFAALALLPFQFGRGDSQVLAQALDARALAAFAAFVLVTTVGGYAFYTAGLRRLPASVASIAALSEVPFTASLAYIFLGDRLTALQLCGALAVLSGVALLSLGPRAGKQSDRNSEQLPPLA